MLTDSNLLVDVGWKFGRNLRMARMDEMVKDGPEGDEKCYSSVVGLKEPCTDYYLKASPKHLCQNLEVPASRVGSSA